MVANYQDGRAQDAVAPVMMIRSYVRTSNSRRLLMTRHEEARRSLLLGLAGMGLTHALGQEHAVADAAVPRGYVLGPDQGEHLVLRGGNIFIKAGPTEGAESLAMGTQQILPGVG